MELETPWKRMIGMVLIVAFGLLAGIYITRAISSLQIHDSNALTINAVISIISVLLVLFGGKLAREPL